MTIDNTLNNIKAGAEILTNIVTAANESPHVKTASNELGKTAVTITQTVNTVLLPLAAVNFAFEKARTYFSEKFAEDFIEKTKSIPNDQIIEPKTSIAGPALQGLAFSHEEENLKEMYLNLLASAMDQRHANNAHPAFVEIIRQITSIEAQLIQTLSASLEITPLVELRARNKKTGAAKTLLRHLMCLTKNQQPVQDSQMPIMIDNFIRLGIVSVDYTKYASGKDVYDWVESRPEYLSILTEITHKDDNVEIETQKGILFLTSFGKQFCSSVGL